MQNELGQFIGFAVPNFKTPPLPNFSSLKGEAATLSMLQPEHFPELFSAFSLDKQGYNWTYLPYGPFSDEKSFAEWAKSCCFNQDVRFYAIFKDKGPAGLVSYLRMDPAIGSIEIGHVHLSPLLQRTREGTEALLLMIEWAFQAGYRRVEWKCDALNAPSRRAAQRLGFSYEGTFRQAAIYKSRNRDTAWFAATSQEWPLLKKAYDEWRDPNNFSPLGQEIKKLSELTNSLLNLTSATF